MSFYEKDGFYYYEDDILGLADFRRWLRGYGSSLRIIEPASLADKVRQNAEEMIRRYELLERITRTETDED